MAGNDTPKRLASPIESESKRVIVQDIQAELKTALSDPSVIAALSRALMVELREEITVLKQSIADKDREICSLK